MTAITSDATREVANIIGTIAKTEGLTALGVTWHALKLGGTLVGWAAHSGSVCALGDTCEAAIASLRSKMNDRDAIESELARRESEAAALRARLVELDAGKESAA